MRASRTHRTQSLATAVAVPPHRLPGVGKRHGAYQLAAIASRLREPSRSPVVVVAGSTFSAAGALYRILPSVAWSAYSGGGALHPAAGVGRGGGDTLPPLPASLRVVKHSAALLGPEGCRETRDYVDVAKVVPRAMMAAAAEGREKRDTELEGPAAAVSPPAVDVEELRQRASTKFTNSFCSLLQEGWCESKGGWRNSADHTAPLTVPQVLAWSDDDAQHDATLPPASAACTGAEPPLSTVHWVVPLILTDPLIELQRLVTAWRGVLLRARQGEVASLVVVANTDLVRLELLLGVEWDLLWRRALNLASSRPLKKSTRARDACKRCRVEWCKLSARSTLHAALQPLQRFGLRFDGGAVDTPGVPGKAPEAVAGKPVLSVPLVLCERVPLQWRRGNSWLSPTLCKLRAMHGLQRVGTPFSRGDGGAAGAAVAQHAVTLRRDRHFEPRLLLKERDTLAYPPYALVADAPAKRAEQQRAWLGNATEAAVMLHLCAVPAATAPGQAQRTAACDLEGAPRCRPRYFTALVADAGPLLTREASISDVFVLEFCCELIEGKSWEGFCRWVESHPPAYPKFSIQRRYNCLLSLIAATNRAMTGGRTPRSSERTRSHVEAASRYLSRLVCSRRVFVWPVTDPREGRSRLRIAFAVTREFVVSPTDTGCWHDGEEQVVHGATADGGAGNAAPAAAGASSAEGREVVHSLEAVVRFMLERMACTGWVLVWQEAHQRWPTAVAPPCLCTDAAAAAPSSAAALRRVPAAQLRARVATSVEEWRRTQLLREHKRYDVDPSAEAALAASQAATSETRGSAGAEVACEQQSYTSLDFWQAAVVPASAGFFLWEGQSVFLDDGRPGVIVGFRPPPEGLFAPYTCHATELERAHWRAKQEEYADFIRFYEWRRRCCEATPAWQMASAFSALPHYVCAREMSCFPVVRICRGKRERAAELVHVLPRLALHHTVRYPCFSVTTAGELRRWYEAHELPVPATEDLVNEQVRLRSVGVDGRSTSQVTLLRLPLSLHRVETLGALYVRRTMEATGATWDPYLLQLLTCTADTEDTGAASAAEAAAAWMELHQAEVHEYCNAAQQLHWLGRGARVAWASFLKFSKSVDVLRFVEGSVLDDRDEGRRADDVRRRPRAHESPRRRHVSPFAS